jgi:hypothetical protein
MRSAMALHWMPSTSPKMLPSLWMPQPRHEIQKMMPQC